MRQTKRTCVILYNSRQEFIKLWESKRQNRTSSVDWTVVVELETQSIESINFTTTIWKDELQDKLAEMSDQLNKINADNKQ